MKNSGFESLQKPLFEVELLTTASLIDEEIKDPARLTLTFGAYFNYDGAN